MIGTLYVVATPIGNLEDISARALRILGDVALIAAEDTRVTRKLLSRYEIRTPLTSCHAHTGAGKLQTLVDRLLAGEDVAVVSDAGTPGISDPGGELVRAAIEAEAPVVPIPGPSAVIAALSASGLDPSRFLFHGFLPRSAGDKRKALQPIAALPYTLVFYESPERLAATLGTLQQVLGDREAAVAREITKKFEEWRRGTLSQLAASYKETAARGECVVLVSGAGEQDAPRASEETVIDRLAALMNEGVSLRDASRQVAEALDLPRKDVYQQALALRADAVPPPG